jgi:hypothetical protein
MTSVFTDAGKVAGFIISRGVMGFEAFSPEEHSLGGFKTLEGPAAALRELAAMGCPDGD